MSLSELEIRVNEIISQLDRPVVKYKMIRKSMIGIKETFPEYPDILTMLGLLIEYREFGDDHIYKWMKMAIFDNYPMDRARATDKKGRVLNGFKQMRTL